MTMHAELNRLGRDITDRRRRDAEAVAWLALNIIPLRDETAEQVLARIRFFAERSHPALVQRFEHHRLEILPRADDCGCDPNGDGYDDDHCEGDEGGEYLCARQHLGFVCGTCENADDDGPDWRSDRYEWPCPAVAKLDAEAVTR